MPLTGPPRPDPKGKPTGKSERVKTTGRGTNKPRRIINPPAVKLAALANRECAACGGSASNGDHFLPRDKGGDDVPENIIGLCGTGTTRCHGAKHGSTYTALIDDPRSAMQFGERRDQRWVMERIGRFVVRHRQDAIHYVLGKLGEEPGRDWLLRTHLIAETEDGWVSLA
jgi:hypothetical protein